MTARRTSLTSAGLVHLRRMTNLKRLTVNMGMTDDGLAHVGNLTELRELMLVRPRVTDTGLKHLKGLTKLRQLILGGSDVKVTHEGVAKLQAAVPSLQLTAFCYKCGNTIQGKVSPRCPDPASESTGQP